MNNVKVVYCPLCSKMCMELDVFSIQHAFLKVYTW